MPHIYDNIELCGGRLSADQLDFIINYDIKFRMGRDAMEEG